MDQSERDRVLRDDLAALRAEQERQHPPSDQLQRIMQRASTRRAEFDVSPWRWLSVLWMPRFRLSAGGLALLSAGVMTATAALLIFQTPTATQRVQAPSEPKSVVGDQDMDEYDGDRRVPVRFMLPAAGAKSVSVVGDFNAWQLDALRLDDSDGDGVFAGTLMLPRGSYGYMFVIDGERWTTDPHATNFRDDGFGQQNAVIRVN